MRNNFYWEVYYGPVLTGFPYMETFATEEEATFYIHEQTGAREIAEDHIYINFMTNQEYYYVRANNKD